MGQPKISVCVPVYNRAGYLQQALESIRAETLEDFEVIVYDDASTEDVSQVCTVLGDPRLRYFRQPRKRGIAGNRNSCLAVARGRYIAWLDSDDLYHPEMLAMQSAVLDRHAEVGLVYGAYENIDGQGRRLPDWAKHFAEDRIEQGKDVFRELALGNFVNSSTVLVRREYYERVGPYSTRLTHSGEDWEMWLRMALIGAFAFTATPVATYRLHGGSSSHAARANGMRMRNDSAVIRSVWSSKGQQIPDAAALKKQAQAALAVRAVQIAGEQFVAGELETSFRSTLHAMKCCHALLFQRQAWRLLLSVLRNHEYEHYRQTKATCAVLADILAGTRLGAQVQKSASTAPEWEEKQRQIAGIIRQVVPQGKRVAAVDKHDPTFLHLSQRAGWHFPDHRLLPGGYPEDSGTAIAHLEDLRQRGASFLVLPSASFLWLDHYEGFRRHLHDFYPRLWSDHDCIIFQLSHGGRHGQR